MTNWMPVASPLVRKKTKENLWQLPSESILDNLLFMIALKKMNIH